MRIHREKERERRKERVTRLIYARVLIKSHNTRVSFSKSDEAREYLLAWCAINKILESNQRQDATG